LDPLVNSRTDLLFFYFKLLHHHFLKYKFRLVLAFVSQVFCTMPNKQLGGVMGHQPPGPQALGLVSFSFGQRIMLFCFCNGTGCPRACPVAHALCVVAGGACQALHHPWQPGVAAMDTAGTMSPPNNATCLLPLGYHQRFFCWVPLGHRQVGSMRSSAALLGRLHVSTLPNN